MLSKGENIAVEAALGGAAMRLAIAITADLPAHSTNIVSDTSVLILGENGRVRSSRDLVFYNQPVGADGAVRLKVESTGEESPGGESTVEVDLARLPDEVDRIVIAASIDLEESGDVTFGAAEAVRMRVNGVSPNSSGDRFVISELTDLTDERAVIFGEIYRRESEWKIRAVGQGYRDGLRPLVIEYGVEVDDPAEVVTERTPDSSEPVTAQSAGDSAVLKGPDTASKVALSRRRKPVAKLPGDWKDRVCPGLPADPNAGPWRPARLFPTVGMKSSAEQEGRSTSVLLSVMATVPEFGKRIVARLGAPRGRVETFTEVAFTLGGKDLRPDGLIRVTRGAKTWVGLVEVKTAKGVLSPEQVEGYIQVARSKGFDAVVTITCDLVAEAGELPIRLPARPPKSVSVRHLSWEEILTEAALSVANDGLERTHRRIMEQFLQYGSEHQSGMWHFGDMGRHWVKVRNGISDGTLSSSDPATADICSRFDRLLCHVALQLTALTGQSVTASSPGDPADVVSRAKQLADSGELFGTLKVVGATGPIVVNANLVRLRIACSQTVDAPRAGRVGTKVNWLVRQLDGAPPRLKLTAHHLGSRTETTSALLDSVRDDADVLSPPDGRDIREFTVTGEASMGSKRAATENGFVSSLVNLVNQFHVDVTEVLKTPRDER